VSGSGEVTLRPIGVVRGGRVEPEDDGWDAEVCTIELDAERFTAEVVAGLADFSHVEVVFQFHLVDEAAVVTTARHPREREDWPKVGIFAQRGRVRPNRLGVSVAALERVDGTDVVVRGLDAVDGTPVLDLKPVLREFLPRGQVRQPAWSTELMAGYWGPVTP
jgi:tRNA-Thr(GGU) m(6)t(6)A37 methyltransferase TsaA